MLCRLGRKGGSSFCFRVFVFISFLCLWRTLGRCGACDFGACVSRSRRDGRVEAASAEFFAALAARGSVPRYVRRGSSGQKRNFPRHVLVISPCYSKGNQTLAPVNGVTGAVNGACLVEFGRRPAWSVASLRKKQKSAELKKKKETVTPTVVQRRSLGYSSSACRARE